MKNNYKNQVFYNDCFLCFLSHFSFLISFLMEAKFPNNYHLSIVIGPLFFWRISAKRIERLRCQASGSVVTIYIWTKTL